jgi:hypothetical protein
MRVLVSVYFQPTGASESNGLLRPKGRKGQTCERRLLLDGLPTPPNPCVITAHATVPLFLRSAARRRSHTEANVRFVPGPRRSAKHRSARRRAAPGVPRDDRGFKLSLVAAIAARSQLIREQARREGVEDSERKYAGSLQPRTWHLDGDDGFVSIFANQRLALLLRGAGNRPQSGNRQLAPFDAVRAYSPIGRPAGFRTLQKLPQPWQRR